MYLLKQGIAKPNLPQKSIFENGPHVKSAFPALQCNGLGQLKRCMKSTHQRLLKCWKGRFNMRSISKSWFQGKIKNRQLEINKKVSFGQNSRFSQLSLRFSFRQESSMSERHVVISRNFLKNPNSEIVLHKNNFCFVLF